MSISQTVYKLEKENQTLKEEIERLKQLYGDGCKPMRCQECLHFHQYYTRYATNCYLKMNDGYCVAGKRTKRKQAEDERCQFFEKK